jgi:hypothetical protein
MQAVYWAVLPIGHPLTNFLGQHYNLMRAFDPDWQNHATHFPELCSLKGVFHLQWISLKLTKYFSQHDHNFAVVTCLDPTAIMDPIQEQSQWEPNLMDVFARQYNIQAFMMVHGRGSASTGTTPTASLSSSAGSIVSSLTSTPSLARQLAGAQPPGNGSA